MKKNKRLIVFLLVMTIITGGLSLSLMLLGAARDQNNTYINIDFATIRLVQTLEPKEGDPVAIVDTTIGEIRFVLYPQYAPNAVKNFTELAESGYYDNTYVFDAQKGAYSGLGAKDKNGGVEGGYDQPRERVLRELHQDLWPFRGAVCMVNTAFERSFKEKLFGGGDYYCGSRFNIMNSIAFDDEKAAELREISGDNLLTDTFVEKGGIPNFSQQMTIIGQTYKGFDVVDALASLEAKTNGTYLTPNEDIIIKSVKITTYSPEDETKNDDKNSDLE